MELELYQIALKGLIEYSTKTKITVIGKPKDESAAWFLLQGWKPTESFEGAWYRAERNGDVVEVRL